MPEAPTKKRHGTGTGISKPYDWGKLPHPIQRRKKVCPFGPGRAEAYAAHQAHLATFTIRERDLQKQLGVSSRAIIKMRCATFTFDIDWIRKPWTTRPAHWSPGHAPMCQGHSVWYTPAAAQRLLELFVQNQNVTVANPDEFFLEVVRANFLNTRILQAKDGQDQVLMVRVPDARKFVPGMKLKVTRIPGQEVLELVGRGPRTRGVW